MDDAASSPRPVAPDLVRAPADLRLEVQDLYDRYVEVLDDGPLEAWPQLFTDQCLYLLIPRENHEAGLPLALIRAESRGMLRDRVVAVQETMMHEPRYVRHLISNIRIRDLSEDHARMSVVANYAVLETLRDQFTRVLNAGRMLDVVVREADGALRFQEKLCVYDSELVPNSIIIPI